MLQFYDLCIIHWNTSSVFYYDDDWFSKLVLRVTWFGRSDLKFVVFTVTVYERVLFAYLFQAHNSSLTWRKKSRFPLEIYWLVLFEQSRPMARSENKILNDILISFRCWISEHRVHIYFFAYQTFIMECFVI